MMFINHFILEMYKAKSNKTSSSRAAQFFNVFMATLRYMQEHGYNQHNNIITKFCSFYAYNTQFIINFKYNLSS